MERLVDDFGIFFLFVGFEAFNPRGVFGCVQKFRHSCQRILAVAPNGQIDWYVLVELGAVNIEVDYLCLLSIGGQIACYTVIETHAHSDEQVTLVGHHVRTKIAVHTEDTLVETMVGRNGRKSEERGSAGEVGFLKEGTKLLLCIAQFHTLTHEHKGLHAVVNHLGCTLDVGHVHIWLRLIAADEVHLCRFKIHHARLCILGKVEHHRARTTTAGNIERTSYCPSHILSTTNLVAPLADR